MNGESCMHLFRLSMIPEIYCQFCFLPCTMSKSPVKVIIMTIIYLTTQTRCFVFLPCVYMHEHIMYRKYAASDALNGIEICQKNFKKEIKSLSFFTICNILWYVLCCNVIAKIYLHKYTSNAPPNTDDLLILISF